MCSHFNQTWLSKRDGNAMKKLALLIVTLVASGLVNAADKKPVTLRIATLAPEASAWVQAMRQGAKDIKNRTAGRVVIKLYPGGIQGSDRQVLRKFRTSLQGGAFTPSAFADLYPDINLYSLPLTFESEAEAAYVRSRMDIHLINGLKAKGYICFGIAGTGFALIMSSKPIYSAADLKGKKVWVPEGDGVSYRSMQALGVSPQPLPLTDVLLGLRTNLIDIAPVSSLGALFMQWHTSVDYLTDMPLVYTYGFMVIKDTAFKRIDPKDREIVRQVMEKIYSDADAAIAVEDAKAKQVLLDHGMQRIVPSAAEVASIRKTMADSNRKLAQEGVISEALYDEMLRYIDEYRSKQESADENVTKGAEAA